MIAGALTTPIAAVCGVVGGLVAGSFLATIAVRWPEGRRISAGRSACDHCSATLEAANLIPLWSFLAQRGRCSACLASIDRIHPAMELVCAAVGGLSAAAFAHEPILAIAAAMFGWQLALLAALDWRAYWLPDRLCLLLLMTGLLFALGNHLNGPLAALGGAACGYLSLELIRRVFLAIRDKEGMGQGDPKLFGAIGAWVGWQQLGPILLAAALAGIFAYAWQRTVARPAEHGGIVPFGTMLAAASWPLWMWQYLT